MHLIRWQTRCNWAIVSQLWLSYYCNVCGPSITKCPGHITETKQWVLCPWVDHYTIGFRPLYMMWWSIIQNAMMTYLPRRRAGIWKVFTEVVSLYSDLGLVKVLEKGEQSLQKHARDQRMVSMKPMRYLNGEVWNQKTERKYLWHLSALKILFMDILWKKFIYSIPNRMNI